MRLLLIADTHVPKRARDLPERVWDKVSKADVVMHAGDWVDASLLDKLEARAKRLIDVTYEAFARGLAAVKPGARTGDIGHAIQSYVESMRCSVVRDFCGHGLGKVFHDAPNILHFGQAGTGAVLRTGMFFTIEPMVNLGKHPVKILADGWTAVTRDKSLSAQCEHSIGVTETGYEVFTASPTGQFRPPVIGA